MRLARSGRPAQPEVGPPAQGAADRGQRHPSRQQHRRGRHLPVEAVRQGEHQQGLLITERLCISGAHQGGTALVVEAAIQGGAERPRLTVHHQAVAEMQHAAALVPPDAAATQEIGIEHADGGLAAEQVGGRGRPVHAPLVGVEGLPVGQRRQAAEVHAAMGRGAQPHHLAGGAGLVKVAVAVVAQAHEGLTPARAISSTALAGRGPNCR